MIAFLGVGAGVVPAVVMSLGQIGERVKSIAVDVGLASRICEFILESFQALGVQTLEKSSLDVKIFSEFMG